MSLAKRKTKKQNKMQKTRRFLLKNKPTKRKVEAKNKLLFRKDKKISFKRSKKTQFHRKNFR
jgi:hypothetical protein